MAFLQKIVRNEIDVMDIAIKYYSILSTLHNLAITVRQIQLLAFTAIRGTITPPAAREEFVRMFGSSLNSLENMKGKLHKKGMLVEEADGMYRVNPQILPDFSQDLYIFELNINLKNAEHSEE